MNIQLTWCWAIVVLGMMACPPAAQPDSGVDAGATLDAETADRPGDSCATAVPFEIPTDGGTLTITGDATGFLDHASCSNLSGHFGVGPDFLYRFSMSASQALVFDIDGGAIQFLPNDCSVDCPKFYPAPTPALVRTHFKFPVRSSGTAVMAAEAAGPFSIQVGTRPLMHGDLCDDPITVRLDAGSFALETDLRDAFSENYQPSVTNLNAADLFFAVPVTEPSALDVGVSSDAGVTLWITLVDPVSTNACGAPPYQPATTFASRELAPGTSFMGVQATAPGDGYTGAPFNGPTPLRVDVAVRPLPQGDSCTNPLPLVFATDGGTEVATASGDTRTNVAGVTINCGSRSANDVALEFMLTSPRSVSALLTTTTPSYRPALGFIAGQCAGLPAACNVALVPGAGAALTATALPAGTYFLWVGGADDTSGTWSLSVTLTP